MISRHMESQVQSELEENKSTKNRSKSQLIKVE